MEDAITKPVAPPGKAPGDAPPGQLKGNLGLGGILFNVIAYNAPIAGVAGYMPLVIGMGNGNGAPLSFFVIGALLLVFSVGFTAMVPHVGSPGAMYAYITGGLGRPIGLAGAFIAITTYLAILAGSYGFVGLVVNQLVHGVLGGPDLPWWLGAGVLWAAVSVFSLFSIDVSAKILTILTCCELVLIALWELFVAIKGGPEGHPVSSFAPSSFTHGNLGVGLIFAALCFTGFECTAVFRQEARNPKRDVPRATYITVIFLALMYGLGAWLFITSFGTHGAVAAGLDPTESFSHSVGSYLGRVARDAVAVLLVTSGFAGLLANQNIASRYLFALGHDRVLPRSLGSVHLKHRSPFNAAVVVAVITLVIDGIGALSQANVVSFYSALTGIGSFCLVLSLTAVSLSIAFFLRKRVPGISVWRSTVAPLVAFVGLLVVLVFAAANLEALTGSAGSAVVLEIAIAVIAVSGIGLAFFLKHRRTDIYDKIGRQEL